MKTRRLLRVLVALAAGLQACAPALANLLPNSSFEAGSDPREIHPIIVEYRHTAGAAWQLDSRERFHGERSLRMAGTTPFFWQVGWGKGALRVPGNAFFAMGSWSDSGWNKGGAMSAEVWAVSSTSRPARFGSTAPQAAPPAATAR